MDTYIAKNKNFSDYLQLHATTEFAVFIIPCKQVCTVFKNGLTPAYFLVFIFGIFKHKFYRKTVGVSGIRTRIVGVEGKHDDHLTTTTTAQFQS